MSVLYLPHMELSRRYWRQSGPCCRFQPVHTAVLIRELFEFNPKIKPEKYLAELRMQGYLPDCFVPPFRLSGPGPYNENSRPEQPPKVIRCRSGDFDVLARKLLPHDPLYCTSAVVDLEYDPTAKAPKFERFLERLVPDPDSRRVLIQYLGNCLVTEPNSFKNFLCVQGPRDCGKSVLFDAFQSLVGKENMSNLSTQALCGRFPGLIPTMGKLVNIDREAKYPTRAEAAVVKAISGGDSVSAEIKGGANVEMTPTIRMIFVSNDPVVFPDDHIWGRVLVVKCGATIPRAEQDRNLRAELQSELPGIFAMLVHAAAALYRHTEYGLGGYVLSESMNEVVEQAKLRSSYLKEFVGRHIKLDPTQHIKDVELVEAYAKFCEDGNFQKRHDINQIKDELDRQFGPVGIEVRSGYRVNTGQGKRQAIRGLTLSDFVQKTSLEDRLRYRRKLERDHQKWEADREADRKAKLEKKIEAEVQRRLMERAVEQPEEKKVKPTVRRVPSKEGRFQGFPKQTEFDFRTPAEQREEDELIDRLTEDTE